MRLPRRFAPLVILAAVGLAVALFLLKIDRDMVDFNVNLAAGDRLLHGETLYRTSDEHYQFKYAPFCAMIYVPLALLPPTAARAIWYALVLAAVTALLVFTAKLLGRSVLPGGMSAWSAALLAGLVLAKFILREIQLGQINAVITVLLLLVIFNLGRDEAKRSGGRAAASGLLWGLSTAMKPYALIFLPYFLLKRRWDILWPALLFILLTFLAPAAYYGFPGNMAVHTEWVSSLIQTTATLLDSQDNVSLLAMWTKWTGSPGAAQLGYGLFLLALVAVVYLFIRRHGGRPDGTVPEAALLLLLIPLISPLGWDYTFLSSILGVGLVLQRLPAFPRPIRAALVLNFAVIGLSLFDLLGRKAYAAFMAASVLTVNFLVVAAALVWLRWARKI